MVEAEPETSVIEPPPYLGYVRARATIARHASRRVPCECLAVRVRSLRVECGRALCRTLRGAGLERRRIAWAPCFRCSLGALARTGPRFVHGTALYVERLFVSECASFPRLLDSLLCASWLREHPPCARSPSHRCAALQILRYHAKLYKPKCIPDADREFTVSFFPDCDSLAVYEPPKKNSGIVGGKFLSKARIRNPETGSFFAMYVVGMGKRTPARSSSPCTQAHRVCASLSPARARV